MPNAWPVQLPIKNDAASIVAGGLDENVLDAAGIKALATLPSLDELRGKLVGLLQAPAGKFVRTIAEPQAKFVRLLAAYRDQQQAA